ncbi:unnamed protein product [Diamesa hyperborea]
MEYANKKNSYDVDSMLNEGPAGDEADSILNEEAKNEGEKNLLKKPMTVDEHRALRRKTKNLKLGRQNSKEGVLGIGNAPNFVSPQRKWKNSRRSRDGYGRGMTKKAGGGSRNWGKVGSEIMEESELAVDPNDPNYTDEENVELKEIDYSESTLNTEEEFLKNFELAVLEYFETGDTHEVAVELDEHLKTGSFRPLVVRKAIEMAFEHKNSHREMTSVLISDLLGRCLIASDIQKAFDMLLSNLPDSILDTPEAPHVLGNFIARAVADDCLPPKFVQQLSQKGQSSKNGSASNGKAVEEVAGASSKSLNKYALQALEYADGHLSLKSGWQHLDNIWGVAGGMRPVKSITTQMEMLLKEYLLSRDIPEAQRCINALECPHFFHELVYEIVIMTLEALNEDVEDAMGKLLKTLEQNCFLTVEMMEQGFQRVYGDIQDISLDIPLAYNILERFVQRCYNLGVLSERMMKNLPSRGRKRFVSEGDSGKIKPNAMMFRDF